MSVSVSYNALINRLERELTISVTTTENPTKFKRKLSQAKFRAGIEGKLIFSSSADINPGTGEVIYGIAVALAPLASTVNIITVKEDNL